MTTSRDPIYAGYRYPAEIISYAVWLYFRFPLSLRMVEEMLAAREIGVSHETVRQWGLKFGEVFARRVRQRAPQRGDKWHLDEVVRHRQLVIIWRTGSAHLGLAYDHAAIATPVTSAQLANAWERAARRSVAFSSGWRRKTLAI
jgi:putative transposase